MTYMDGGYRGSRLGRWIGLLFVGLLVLAGVAIVVSVLARAAAPAGTYPGFFLFPFFFPFGFFFFILFFFFIGRLFFWPWRSWGYPMAWHYRDEPTDILRRRYAQGELTREQFEQMMRDLDQGRREAP